MAHILVVEDDEGVLRYVRQALENVGHQVVAARDGKEGIALYRENPTDLVITDIVMPERMASRLSWSFSANFQI